MPVSDAQARRRGGDSRSHLAREDGAAHRRRRPIRAVLEWAVPMEFQFDNPWRVLRLSAAEAFLRASQGGDRRRPACRQLGRSRDFVPSTGRRAQPGGPQSPGAGTFRRGMTCSRTLGTGVREALQELGFRPGFMGLLCSTTSPNSPGVMASRTRRPARTIWFSVSLKP